MIQRGIYIFYIAQHIEERNDDIEQNVRENDVSIDPNFDCLVTDFKIYKLTENITRQS